MLWGQGPHLTYAAATGEKWEYNKRVHPLFIDFKEACDSVKTEVLSMFS
jgi:hypothetical protein